MSHISQLHRLKQSCNTTGQCEEYELHLQQEQQKIDHSVANANQTAVVSGVLVGLIGLFILLTPFSKIINRIQKIILPFIITVAPVITGLVIGLGIGFSVSFGACFKQQCSPFESSAVFIIPLLSLLLTVPMAIFIYKKRFSIVKVIDRIGSSIWIIVGALFILFTGINTYSAIDNTIRNGELQKTRLVNVE